MFQLLQGIYIINNIYFNWNLIYVNNFLIHEYTFFFRIIDATRALNEFYVGLIDCLERPKDIKEKLYKLDSSSKILDGISRSSKIMTEKTLREWYTISANSVICDDGDDNDDSDERIEEEEENKRMKKSFELIRLF